MFFGQKGLLSLCQIKATLPHDAMELLRANVHNNTSELNFPSGEKSAFTKSWARSQKVFLSKSPLPPLKFVETSHSLLSSIPLLYQMSGSSCFYFAPQFVDLVLLDERENLNVREIYSFLCCFFPRVSLDLIWNFAFLLIVNCCHLLVPFVSSRYLKIRKLIMGCGGIQNFDAAIMIHGSDWPKIRF